MDLSHYRRHYDQAALKEPLPDDPMDLFKEWLSYAIQDERLKEPNAMSLATVSSQGEPSVRVVLFKEVRERGLVFYTNYKSAKAKDMDSNSSVAATIWWPELERQVRWKGKVQKIDEKDSKSYFHSRPRGSQLGAYISPQSQEIPDVDFLKTEMEKAEALFKGKDKIDFPDSWGGYYLEAEVIEFWQGRPNRLHDRIEYHFMAQDHWSRRRLAP